MHLSAVCVDCLSPKIAKTGQIRSLRALFKGKFAAGIRCVSAFSCCLKVSLNTRHTHRFSAEMTKKL